MTNSPAVNRTLCPVHLGGRCSRCLTACPTGAISLRDGPVIAADLCRDCGACASVCPTGALAHQTAEALSRRLSTRDRRTPLTLACPKAGQFDRHEIPVPGCLSSLGLETLLGLWLRDRETVTLVTGDCSACRTGDGGLTFKATLEQAETILTRSKHAPEAPFTVETRTGRTSSPQRKDNISLSRRGFLGLLASGKPVHSPKDSPQGTQTPGKRMILAEHLQSLNAKGPIPIGMAAGTIQGEGSCTVCSACEKVCAAGALKLTGEEVRTLQLIPALCVDCGACVKVCLPRFLHAAPSDLESLSTTPVTLFRAGVGTCKRCKAQTTILNTDSGYCHVCSHKIRMMNGPTGQPGSNNCFNEEPTKTKG